MSDAAGSNPAGAQVVRQRPVRGSGALGSSTQDIVARGVHALGVEIGWTAVCPYGRLAPDRGVAALVGGAHVAIFRTADGEVYAVGHRDPVNGAHVMSRGIVATRDGAPTIASPSLRHVYDLRTGECLDVPGIRLPVYPVRCRDGLVEVGIADVRHRDVPASGAGRADGWAG